MEPKRVLSMSGPEEERKTRSVQGEVVVPRSNGKASTVAEMELEKAKRMVEIKKCGHLLDPLTSGKATNSGTGYGKA